MPFVVRAGRIEKASGQIAPALPSSLWLAPNVFMDFAELYRRQPQIRTVVAFLARNIAQLGIHVFRRQGDGDRLRLNDHPLAELLSQPAPGTKLTRYGLMTRLVSDLAIYDNAFWLKVKPDEQIAGLMPIPAHAVTPLGGGWLAPEKYRIGHSGGHLDVPADQIVHIHGYDPVNLQWGQSPLESLRGVLAEEYEANQNRQQMWRNGARTSGFIERPIDAPDWSSTARGRFKNEFRALYTGDGPAAGGVPILEDGMKFVAAGLDPKAAQYIEARKLTREEVAAAYHIPPPLVGILDHATFSNIREQHKQLYQDTLGPWLTQIKEDIELQLLSDLPDNKNVYCEFNIAEKLSGSFEEQASQLQTATGAPWMTRNEARGRLNLPAIDGGDELITPLNVLVGDQASPTDSAPDALPATPDAAPEEEQ